MQFLFKFLFNKASLVMTCLAYIFTDLDGMMHESESQAKYILCTIKCCHSSRQERRLKINNNGSFDFFSNMLNNED